MPGYLIDSNASRLYVVARSSVHDTETIWTGITGTIVADATNPAQELEATVQVQMSTADTGDWLKNRKLRKDMQFEKNPVARFVLDSVERREQDGERLNATIRGTLSWRDHSIPIVASGHGLLGKTELSASGTFDIDVTKLGITPPKILMIRVQDVVNCRIELHATAISS